MKTKQSKWLSLLLVLAMALTLLPGAALAAEDPAEDEPAVAEADEEVVDILEAAAANDEAANAGTDAPTEPSEDAQPTPAAEPQESVAAPPADNGILTVAAEDAAGIPAALADASTAGGTIEKITDVAVVDGDTISVSGSTLDWVAADTSIGRWQDGWWVGFKIVAPSSVTSSNVNNVKYSSDGTETLAKNFGQNKDGTTENGKYYMGCWLPVQPGYLATALEKGSNLQWIYKFDWDGDNKVDQTLIATVDPNNITLNKDENGTTVVNCQTVDGVMTIKDGKTMVATVAGKSYETVQAAVTAAEAGATVKMIADSTEQVTVPATASVTLELNGKTLTHKTATTIINNGTLTIQDSVGGGSVVASEQMPVAAGSNSVTTIKSGTYTGVEGAVITGKSTGATINIEGGDFSASDNAVIAGNGTNRTGDGNIINISGGTFNGEIKTNGYVACGIYSPWNDTITVTGGTFNITGGAGIVARAGNITVTGGTFNVTGSAEGWVGDSKDVLPSSAIVFDSSAAYPGMTDNSKIVISGGSFSSEAEAISTLASASENIQRVEVSGGTFSSAVKTEYCAEGYEPVTIDASTYTVGVHELYKVDAVEPTCTEDGTEAYWTCDTCGRKFSDEAGTTEIKEPETIKATGHKLKAVPKKDATCTEAGNVAYWECEVCHKLFSDKDGAKEFEGATGIPATGHNYQMEYDANGHWQECAGCGEKINNSVHTFTDWEVTVKPTEDKTGERTHRCEVCGYQESDEIPKIDSSVKAQVVSEKLDVVPEGLADKFESVEDIKNALLAVSVTEANGYTAEKTEFYDVKLQISTDGGISWFEATEDNFPEGGITVILPYPEGTGKDTHDFVVTHMFGTTSEKLGTKAGETETPKVTKTDDGIQVTLKGLSPVSVSWKDVVKAPPAGEKDTQTPAPTPKAPPTGDNANIGLWAALLAVCALGAGAVLVLGRKRQSR